ncbi:hypothetical protein B0H13DRAFT_2384854 [Mycena leptocephala]|nr:hypothetical protein B0H13DRAFT_2384854 [Mycena leptocephala]
MPSTLRGRKADYQAKAAKLKAQRNEARAQRETADAHAIMAGLHIQSLQYKLNAKGKKRGGNERTLSTTARMLTSAEGRQLAAEKRTAQLEKKAKEDESRAQRLLADAEVIKRCAELGREGMIFSGTIKSLKAPQAKDLAWSLELDENANRDVLIDRILKHFAANEALKEDKRDRTTAARGRAVQNVASGSGSSSDVDMAPPPPPPSAPYRFPDSWTPPQPLIHYDHPIDHPPPFTPQFYGNPPPFQPQFYPVPQYDPSRFHC